MPLLEGLDGKEKMSKSLGNYVGIAEPPQEIFGKLMSISDQLMWRYIELLSFESASTIHRRKAEVKGGANPRDVKVGFAGEIVARFHGAEAARKAQEDFEQRFRDGAAPEDMPQVTIGAPQAGILISPLLKQAGLTPSTSEAQRMIEQGGVKLDGERVSDKNLRIQPGRTVVAQVGKRKFARIRVE
jgi:tyrosyl-tRNA synthetase